MPGLGRLVAASAVVLLSAAGPDLAERAVAGAADGRALLVLVEDAVPADEPYAWVRAEERRADAIVVVRWLRSCDRLQAVWIPRDLAIGDRGESLAVVFGTAGAAGVATLVERAFQLDLFATVTLDLDDVGTLAGDVGPVTIELDAPSRDRRTGFAGGPGPVVLDAERAVTFLRSRTWEELRDGRWTLATDDDGSRIGREQSYVAAALAAVRRLGLVDTLRLGASVGRHADIDVWDPAPVPGFVAAVEGAGDVRLAAVAVAPERPPDARRSPFLPGEAGAPPRSVLAPDGDRAFAAAGCTAGDTR
jgi:hypothetical protein